MSPRATTRILAVTAACFMLAPRPALAQTPPLLQEAFSREYGVFVGEDPSPVARDVCSREVSFFTGTDGPLAYAETVSRECSVVVTTSTLPQPISDIAITVSPTGDSATLDWSTYNELSQYDLLRYRVYVSTGPFAIVSGLTPYAMVPAGTLSITITNLTQWQDHYFAVVPEDVLGGFEPVMNYSAAHVLAPEAISREFSAFIGAEPSSSYAQAISRETTVLITTPAVPERIAQVAISVTPTGGGATLDWSTYNELAQSDVVSYRVYVSGAPFTSVSGMTPFITLPSGTLSLSVSNLTQWQDHYFAVVPVDGLGGFDPVVNYAASYVIAPEAISRELSLFMGSEPASPSHKAFSREVSFLVPDTNAPAPVTGMDSGFAARTSVSAFSAIDLDWSTYNEAAQLDVVRYRVYAATTFYTDVSMMTPVTFAPAGSQRFTLGGLHGGGIYYVAVVAEDALGGWNPAVRSVSAQASIGALGEASQLTAISSSNSIALGWAPPGQVDAFLSRYHLYVNGDTNPVVLEKTATNFIATGLQAATGYAFRLCTVDAFGTESAGLYLPGATLLDNPINLAAQPFDGMVRLTWSHTEPNDLVKHYEVYVTNKSFTSLSGMSPAATTLATRVDVSGLANGTPYFFAVTAVNLLDGVKPQVQTVSATPKTSSGQFADLKATNVSCPTSAYAGETVTFAWSVTNIGASATSGQDGSLIAAWTDRVVISPDSVYGNTNDLALTNLIHGGVLAPGAGYLASTSVQLPTNASGEYFVFVMANVNGQVYEHLDAGTNLAWAAQRILIGSPAAPFVINQPQDQTVHQGYSASFAVQAGGSPPLSYQWFHGTLVLPGQTKETLVITNAQSSDSGFYVVRVGNFAGTAYSDAANLTVKPPPPDLVALRLESATNVMAGQPLTVSWIVTNAGASAANAPWHEALLLTNAPAESTVIPLLTMSVAEPLESKASVTRSQNVIIPAGLSGWYWLAMQIDSSDDVLEGYGETNNLTLGMRPVFVRSPDLRVTQVSGPGTAKFGQSFVLTWSVTNSGNGQAMGAWSDRVWLSSTSNSVSGAELVATVPSPGNLVGQGMAYTNSTLVSLPLTAESQAGSYFLIVQANAMASVSESDELNNLGNTRLTLTLPQRPDLKPGRLAAPSSASPGQSVSLTYSVTNSGAASTTNEPWNETVYLLPDAGLTETNVGSLLTPSAAVAIFTTTNTLAVGASVIRTQSVTVPMNSAVGTMRFALAIDSSEVVVESDESNNIVLATNTTAIPAALTLQLPQSQLLEGGVLAATLIRNGSLANPLTAILTNSDATELSFHPTAASTSTNITIPAGSATAKVYLRGVRDSVADGSESVQVAASANGFLMATASLTVVNTDIPKLFVVFLTNSVEEGQMVAALVTRDTATTNALTVFLESSAPGQLSPPWSVTIPANEVSWTFPVLAVDDMVPELPRAYSLTASASGFESGSANVTILDNDLPQIWVTLSQTNVSEGAGPQATYGTVSRPTAGTTSLQVELASSNIAAALVPTHVTIPASGTSVSFPIAAVDDDLVDGTQSTFVTPYVLDSGSKVRLAEGTGALLMVTDDDGPTLKLTAERKLLPEGLAAATKVTVSRNTPATNAIAVNLASSNPNEATVPSTVRLEQGQSSTEFTLATVADGVEDGNQTVVLRASAPGFTEGIETVVVSDMNLPDLVLTHVTAPAAAEAEGYVNVSYRVTNQGSGTAGSNFVTRVYLSKDAMAGDDTVVGQYRFDAELPPGLYYEQTITMRVPLTAGEYWVVIETDAERFVNETLEDNNISISPGPISVVAGYSAWVETPITTAVAGSLIPLSGRATNQFGLCAPNTLVNVHIMLRDTERIISALTDTNGNFTTTWQPLANEAGKYDIFATHPGVASGSSQDSFTLLGMGATPERSSLKVLEQSTHSGFVQLENLGDVPLTGLAVNVASKPANLTVVATLDGNQLVSQVALSYAISAPTPDASGTVQLQVKSSEGATKDIFFDIVVEALRPRLMAVPTTLKAGMSRGHQTIVEFDVVNQGGLQTGPLTIAIPALPWMTVATANPLPPLLPGHTNRVTLLLTPATNLALGAYSGSLAVSSTNASVSVPFEFRALSEAKGDLLITAVDELTYYAEGSPNLAGAAVVVRDASTRAQIATGLTDTNGALFVGNIPEAYYDIEVTAEKHTAYHGAHLLLPGQTNGVQTFLSRQVVTYNWTVEPIEIEDRYRISIETVFETVVPLPVVTIEPAVIDLAAITADVTQMEIKITNHGLIAANNAVLSLPTHPLWKFETIVNRLGTLPANSSITVPLVIRRVHAEGGGVAKQSADQGPCHALASVCWNLLCGPRTNNYCAPLAVQNARQGCIIVGPGGEWAGTGEECVNCSGTVYVYPRTYKFPSLCDCAFLGNRCLEAEQSFDLNGLAEKLTEALGKLLPPPLQLDEVSVTIGASGQVCTCCEEKELGLAGNAKGSAEVKVVVIIGRKASLPDGLEFSDPGWANIKISASAMAGLRLTTTGTIEVEYEKKCKEDETLCARGSLTLNLFGGLDIEGKAEAKFLADQLTYTGTVSGTLGLGGEISVTLEGCWDKGITLKACGEATAYAHLTGELISPALEGGSKTNKIGPDADTELLKRTCTPTDPPGKKGGPGDDLGPLVEFFPAEPYLSPPEKILSDMGIDPVQQAGVCAHAKLCTDQDAVISRDAFGATLEISNSDSVRLENVAIQLDVRDESGNDATALFGIQAPELNGLSGIDGQGLLAGSSTGIAKWKIVPSGDAAPMVSTTYYVSGSLSYVQSGLPVTVPLAPAAITVLPTPRLSIHYFHERDVISDDPFTDAIEPSLPFNLAVLVQNRGYGTARNFRITSAQPQIVENEKGLLIEFQIIATEVAGRSLMPSLTVDFGEIAPGQIALGRWLMTSTLQGLFVDYKATWEHIDGLGNKKFSIIDDLSIHEMIHLVQADGAFEDGKPDFLVNDVPDLNDLPDTLYLSDGRTNTVEAIQQATQDGPPTAGRMQTQLTAAMPPGWVYLRVAEPSNGAFQLTGIRRSDGKMLMIGTNTWVTDRTFIGLNRRPIREHMLHLVDYNSTGSYTLLYAPSGGVDTTAPTSHVATLPPSSRATFPLSWSGSDDASGVAHFDIFVSENGGPFAVWLQDTTSSGALYSGQLGNTYAFYSTATDKAGNRQPTPSTPDAQTTVSLVNHAPTFSATSDQIVDEGQVVSVRLAATDQDGDSITYSIVGPKPAGLVLDSTTGMITWQTSEADGPSTNVLAVLVEENAVFPLSTTGTVSIVVREVNTAPTLAPLPDQKIKEGRLLTLPLSATDLDVPSQTLTFKFATAPPAGAGITNGVLYWRPTEVQGPSTNWLGVTVSDSGSPSLSATQWFTVVVIDTLPDFAVALGHTNVFVGETNALPVRVQSGLDLTNLAFTIELPVPRVRRLTLMPLLPNLDAALRSTDDDHWNVSLSAKDGLQGDHVVALLGFAADTNEHSAVVPFVITTPTSVLRTGIILTRGAVSWGRAIVIGREPVLEVYRQPAGKLTLYGNVGASYGIEVTTNLVSGTWSRLSTYRLDTSFVNLPPLDLSASAILVRAVQLTGLQPMLSVQDAVGPVYSFLLHGETGRGYYIQTSPSIGLDASWQSVFDLTLTNSIEEFDWTNDGGSQRFFRAVQH
jgi:subtilase family serine protease